MRLHSLTTSVARGITAVCAAGFVVSAHADSTLTAPATSTLTGTIAGGAWATGRAIKRAFRIGRAERD